MGMDTGIGCGQQMGICLFLFAFAVAERMAGVQVMYCKKPGIKASHVKKYEKSGESGSRSVNLSSQE